MKIQQAPSDSYLSGTCKVDIIDTWAAKTHPHS